MREFSAIREDMKKAIRRDAEISLLDLAAEFDALGIPLARAWADNARGTQASRSGAYEDAITYLRRSLDAFMQIEGPERDVSSLQSNLGLVYLRKGDLESALALFKQALAGFLATNDIENAANVSSNIAGVHYYRAEYAEALELYERSLHLYEQAQQPSGIKSVLGNIGAAYSQVGEYPRALEYFYQQLDLYERDGQTVLSGNALMNIGVMYRNTGQFDEALSIHHRALEVTRADGDLFAVLSALRGIAEDHATRGDHEKAIPPFRESLALAREISSRSEEANTLIGLCSALNHAGQSEEAGRILNENEDLLRGYPVPSAYSKVVRGLILKQEGRYDEALELLRTALREVTEKSMKGSIADITKDLRDLARSMRDIDLYIEYNDQYQRVKDELTGATASRRLAMQEKERALAAERERVQKQLDVLHATLPMQIADRVARGEIVHDEHPLATVMFLDIVGFTTLSSGLSAADVVELLQSVFRRIDAICDEFDVTPIKTIGDSYMAAAIESNTEDQRPNTNSVVNAARAAVGILATLSEHHPELRVRIGLHCGPVIAGVLGTKRLQYDIWGDTVNVASRMETHGEPGRIHVSEAFASRLRGNDEGMGPGLRRGDAVDGGDDENNRHPRGGGDPSPLPPIPLSVISRGTLDIKGKGPMKTYWLEGA
jgi:class 3 adenylate cyclase/Tfp pilus assembly protein PilF